MLRNNWVIIDKEPIQGKRGAFNYTIIPIDSGVCDEDVEAWNKCITSKQRLAVGTYTDDELIPLQEIYENCDTDIATIECVKVDLQRVEAIQTYVFGRRFGDFYFLADPAHPALNMKPGDHIMLHRTYNIPKAHDDEDDDDEDEEKPEKCPIFDVFPVFHPLYNITTKQKSAYFHTIGDINDIYDECEMVVVLSRTPVDSPGQEVTKHLFVNSRKFRRHISFCVDEFSPEFRAAPGDKVLLERYFDKNTKRHEYRILSNLSIDAMRNKFLVNTK